MANETPEQPLRFPEARFRITSGLPTIRSEMICQKRLFNDRLFGIISKGKNLIASDRE